MQKVVKFLLEKGTDADIYDNFGLRPIQYCKDKKILDILS